MSLGTCYIPCVKTCNLQIYLCVCIICARCNFAWAIAFPMHQSNSLPTGDLTHLNTAFLQHFKVHVTLLSTLIIWHFTFLVLTIFLVLRNLEIRNLGPIIASCTIYYKFIKFHLSAPLLFLNRSSWWPFSCITGETLAQRARTSRAVFRRTRDCTRSSVLQ